MGFFKGYSKDPKDWFAWFVGVTIILCAMYFAFSTTPAEAAEQNFILECERAGGVVLKTARDSYCMKKELFIDDKEINAND
jgi:hypothetical protein